MEDIELYIKVEKGEPVDDPIAGWNMRMFWPDCNPNNVPKGYERFTRKPLPELKDNEYIDGVEYVRSNYGWTDHYIIKTR
jgi:hypothetical protein